jgi:hypothetical protein
MVQDVGECSGMEWQRAVDILLDQAVLGMVRFGSVRFFRVFLRTENRTDGPVLRFCRTENRTVGSVQNGPVLVRKVSEPRTGPSMGDFFFH